MKMKALTVFDMQWKKPSIFILILIFVICVWQYVEENEIIETIQNNYHFKLTDKYLNIDKNSNIY